MDNSKMLGCGKTQNEFDAICKKHEETFRLGNLTVAETREIVTLDYTLTWGFGDIINDKKRYTELSKKRWTA